MMPAATTATVPATTAMSTTLGLRSPYVDDQRQRDYPKTFGKFRHRRTSKGTQP